MHASQEESRSLIQITARADFLIVQSKGRKWVSKGLILQTRPNACSNDSENKRIGFTVTKRVDKSAVKRNRIKRRLRAVAADVLPNGAKDGQDYILVGRKETLRRPYADLCKDLRWCLRKMELEKS